MYSLITLSIPLPPATWPWLFALLLAHLVGDFVLQSDAMVRNKRESSVLLNHAAIHAALAYSITGCWTAWGIPLVVFLSHAGIDFVKARATRTQLVFWVDQTAHLVVIAALAIAGAASGRQGSWTMALGHDWSRVCVVISGAIVCIRVLSVVISFWVQPYLNEIKESGQDTLATGAARGLTNGGRTIGQWERALIFLLVLVGQPGGVGFLIAAKSIFRFGELMDRRNRMEAEYITVGTLMSFGTAIAVAFSTLALAQSL